MENPITTLFPALLLASALALPTQGQVPSSRPSPTPGAQTKNRTLHFGWPIPAKATITERSLQRGRKSVTSYRFEIAPDPKDKTHWIAQLSDIKVKEMDTAGATPEQVALSKKILGAISSALPTLSIDPKTLEAKARGVRKGVETVIQILKENAKTDKDKQLIALISKSMASEAMLNTLRTSSLSFWKAWAEVWNGLAIPIEGSSRSFKGVMYYPTGGKGECKVKLTNLGSPKGKPGLIQLRYQQTGSGDILTAIVRLMKTSLPPAYRNRINKDMFESGKLSVNIRATLDRKTLLPQRVLIEKRTKIKMKGKPARERIELHDYRFLW